MIASRRSFLFGASATLIAAPAIVRVAANLMPVSTTALRPDINVPDWIVRWAKQLTDAQIDLVVFGRATVYVTPTEVRTVTWNAEQETYGWSKLMASP